MVPSRRRFLHDSLAAVGGLALPITAQAHAARPEPAYLRLAREGRLRQIEKDLSGTSSGPAASAPAPAGPTGGVARAASAV